jgi:hypothetical protein
VPMLSARLYVYCSCRPIEFCIDNSTPMRNVIGHLFECQFKIVRTSYKCGPGTPEVFSKNEAPTSKYDPQPS